MGQENCYYCNSEDEQLNQSLFVPEDIYKRYLLELENTEFDYGHNVNHKIEE